jgi:hypothetical protein
MKNALLPALILIALVGCSSRDNYRLDAFKRLDNGTITFDLTRQEQHIKAVCNASESECSDLALRAGNPIDCYVHTSASSPDVYSVKVDPYVGSGLVCHVGEGHGRILIARTQTCIDMKEVTLSLVGGKFRLSFRPSNTFFHASRDEQIKYLNATDPEFAKASLADQASYLNYLAETGDKRVDVFDQIADELWSAYVPTTYDDGQIKEFVQGLNAKSADFSQYRVKKPLLAPAYQDYSATADSPLHFCKHEKDRYYNESGNEVQEDTVLLVVLESGAAKH